jgi:SGNH hydrolase-like domain, acetyltransferase AlgX
MIRIGDRLRRHLATAAGRALGVVGLVSLALFVFVAARGLDAVVGARIMRPWALGLVAAYGLVAAGIVLVAAAYRRRRAPVIVALGSLVVSLALGEVALRVLYPMHGMRPLRFYFSPRYHHVMEPSAKLAGKLVPGRPPDVAVTNEDGFRTTYSRASFLEKKTRIAILGDSYAYGMGLPQGKAVPQRMEKILEEKTGRTDIGVLNTGVVSYSPFVERLLFDDLVVAYRPTAVLLLLDATDIGDDDRYAAAAREKDGRTYFPRESAPPIIADAPTLLEHLAIYERLYPRSLLFTRWLLHPIDAVKVRDDRREIGLHVPGRFFIFKRPLDETRPFFEATLRNVAAVAAAAKAIGASFALVVPPRYQHWNAKECPDNWEASEYAPVEPYQGEYLRFFDEAKDRAGFPILTLLPEFQAASKDGPLVFTTDPHWNERGAELVAETLARYVIAEGLLSGAPPAR